MHVQAYSAQTSGDEEWLTEYVWCNCQLTVSDREIYPRYYSSTIGISLFSILLPILPRWVEYFLFFTFHIAVRRHTVEVFFLASGFPGSHLSHLKLNWCAVDETWASDAHHKPSVCSCSLVIGHYLHVSFRDVAN